MTQWEKQSFSYKTTTLTLTSYIDPGGKGLGFPEIREILVSLEPLNSSGNGYFHVMTRDDQS